MPKTQFFVSFSLILASFSELSRLTETWKYPANGVVRKSAFRLSKPLIGEDGRVYACSEKTLFAFESNGTIAWSLDLDFACNIDMAPVHGGIGKIYLVAENRVMKVDYLKIGTPKSVTQLFFGPPAGQKSQVEIAGLAVSTLSSSVFINLKNRGLFAYATRGQMIWSAGPMLHQLGYRQGCRQSAKDCYFASVPVIDQCEASIYISNTQGELYSISLRGPHFNWIQDFSSFDKVFTVTPGNNGFLYVTIPVKALVFALDTLSGTILWQKSIGPLSTVEYRPVVDSNGWLSIGSLDGFLYSFSPTGALYKFSKSDAVDSVIQVSPIIDCSGYAVYITQTKMSTKIIHTIGEYTYVSAMKPEKVVFFLLVPATGSVYWSKSYPGQFSSLLPNSDLQHFVLDESLVLSFVAAAKTGNPLPCRTTRPKLDASCSQMKAKPVGVYTGNERAILLFLFFESLFLLLLAAVVRFCCIFWQKKKLQVQHLGNFLEKRRSLQLKKKEFDRTITELEQKAADNAVASEVIEKLTDLVKERKGIERKLSTTYSLGRDKGSNLMPKSLLPLYDLKSRSYSFRDVKRESSVTIFHTLSSDDITTSSGGESSETSEGEGESRWDYKGKGKALIEEEISESESESDYGVEKEFRRSPSEPGSSSRLVESISNGVGNVLLKRRRTFSSTN